MDAFIHKLISVQCTIIILYTIAYFEGGLIFYSIFFIYLRWHLRFVITIKALEDVVIVKHNYYKYYFKKTLLFFYYSYKF